jgi:large conductance mechanosensitive channel
MKVNWGLMSRGEVRIVWCGNVKVFLSVEVKERVIAIRKLVQTAVDFLLAAVSVFLLVKIFNRLKGGEQTYKIKQLTNLKVLQEIRDILKEDKTSGLQGVKVPRAPLITKSAMKIYIKNKRNEK